MLHGISLLQSAKKYTTALASCCGRRVVSEAGVTLIYLVVFLVAQLSVSREARGAGPLLEGEEEEVEIHGQRELLPTSALSPTVASTVIEGEELRGAGASAAQVLSRAAGIQVSRAGARSDLSTASIRGSDSNQVPIYVAGIRINDDVTGTADLSTIPLWMMERIDVFRGNAPERADQLGIGGAIFFTPRVPRTSRAGGGLGVGSYGERAGWVSGEVAGEGASALVALRHSRADNDYKFINDEGQRFELVEQEERRRNADFSENEMWALGRYQLGRGAHVQSIVQMFDREQGVSGLSVIPALKARAKTRRQLFGLSTRLPCQQGQEDCIVELSTSLLTTNVVHTDPYLELPALRTRTFQNRGERLTQVGRLSFNPSSSIQLSTSLLHNAEYLRVDRVSTSGRRGQRHRTRAAGDLKWQVTQKVLTHVLLAAECNTTRGTSERFNQEIVQDSGTCGLFAPAGRVGVQFKPVPSISILANGARYLRAPTLSELYGSSALVNGNTELSVEKGWSVDIGTRAVFHSVDPQEWQTAFDVFFFARRSEDLIRFRRTSLKSVSPFNVDSARFVGAEMAGAMDALGFLRTKTTVSLLDPRETTPDSEDPTTNDILPLTSRVVLNQQLELYRKRGVSWLEQGRTALIFRYYYRSSRYQDSAGLTVLPEQHFIEVEALSSFWQDRISLRFAGRYSLRKQASDLLGLPMPHNSFHAQLDVWF